MTTTTTGRRLTTHAAITEVLTADDIAARLENAAPGTTAVRPCHG